MNEAQIRERLRQAVGESRYPAYLTSRVEARLRNPEAESSARAVERGDQSPWLLGFGRTSAFAAALLILLLVAAVVIGAHEWRPTRPVPAGLDPAIAQYQTMVATDDQRFINTPGWVQPTCDSFADTKCVSDAELQTTVMQRWLDDLNRSRPPARFAAVDALLRRHLALAISANNAFITGFEKKNVDMVNAANNTVNSEVDSVLHLAGDIVASSLGTIASHTSAVRSDKAYLLACSLCQRLLGQDQVSCQTGQTPSCADEIAEVRLQVETFQSDLVFDVAPDSLATKDARLQADLVSADVALEAMETARSSGDSVGLQTGLDALRQALGRVESDAASIAGSN